MPRSVAAHIVPVDWWQCRLVMWYPNQGCIFLRNSLFWVQIPQILGLDMLLELRLALEWNYQIFSEPLDFCLNNTSWFLERGSWNASFHPGSLWNLLPIMGRKMQPVHYCWIRVRTGSLMKFHLPAWVMENMSIAPLASGLFLYENHPRYCPAYYYSCWTPISACSHSRRFRFAIGYFHLDDSSHRLILRSARQVLWLFLNLNFDDQLSPSSFLCFRRCWVRAHIWEYSSMFFEFGASDDLLHSFLFQVFNRTLMSSAHLEIFAPVVIRYIVFTGCRVLVWCRSPGLRVHFGFEEGWCFLKLGRYIIAGSGTKIVVCFGCCW